MVVSLEMPPRPPKAASAAADVLRRRIISGDLTVGDSLPTEIQLVHDLGISRPTVRAALRILENEQLITVRRGRLGGAWINPPTTSELARRAGIYLQYHGITLDEVHRARAAIEPPAARIVAAASDPAAIARLTAMVDDEQRSIADRAAFRHAALGFHQAIVELAGNHTLVVLSAMIHGVIECHVVRYQTATRPYRHGAARHDEHRRFVELVKAGDADGAERLWAEHLEAAREVLLREAGVDSVVELLHGVGPLMAGRGATIRRIRVPKAAEMVADALRRRVILGEYDVGELLPNETSLMTMFGVARTTVRDAFRVLESEGLLEVRRGGGGGARVRAPGISIVTDYAALLLQFDHTTIADVHVAHELIEAPAAGVLARQRDADVIRTLQAIVEREATADDLPTLVREQRRFHRAVVELTGNRALALLCAVAGGLIADQLAHAQAPDTEIKAVTPDVIERADRAVYDAAHKAHTRLVALIAAGDEAGAVALWRRHLELGTAHLVRETGPELDLLP